MYPTRQAPRTTESAPRRKQKKSQLKAAPAAPRPEPVQRHVLNVRYCSIDTKSAIGQLQTHGYVDVRSANPVIQLNLAADKTKNGFARSKRDFIVTAVEFITGTIVTDAEIGKLLLTGEVANVLAKYMTGD